MRRFQQLSLYLCLIALAGCGRQTVAPVSGRGTLDGAPLPNATVVFQPSSREDNPGPGSTAKTNAQGEYSLTLMTGQTSGAIIGPHIVRITAYEGDDGTVPSSGKDNVFRKRLLGPEYHARSALTFEVPPEGTTTANFDLKSPK